MERWVILQRVLADIFTLFCLTAKATTTNVAHANFRCLDKVKSDVYLSHDQGYIKKDIFERFLRQIEKVDNKIGGLINQTKQQLNKKDK